MDTFLQSLITCEVSVNSIDVASKVLAIPPLLYPKYLLHVMEQIMAMGQSRDSQTLAAFLIQALNNNITKYTGENEGVHGNKGSNGEKT